MTSVLWKGEEQQSQAEVRLLETLNSHKCKDTHKPAMGGGQGCLLPVLVPSLEGSASGIKSCMWIVKNEISTEERSGLV